MLTRKELEKRIEKKDEEIAYFEKLLGEAKAYRLALADLMKLCPAERSSDEQAKDTLRPGSDMARAQAAIFTKKRPLHIEELMQLLGMKAEGNAKTSFAGSLSNYARRGKIFSRPYPNTFGLLESHRPDGYSENPLLEIEL